MREVSGREEEKLSVRTWGREGAKKEELCAVCGTQLFFFLFP